MQVRADKIKNITKGIFLLSTPLCAPDAPQELGLPTGASLHLQQDGTFIHNHQWSRCYHLLPGRTPTPRENSCIFRLLPQLRNFSDNKEDINSVVQRAPGCEKVGQKQQACFLQFLWKGRWSTGVYNASHKLTPRSGPEILPMSVHHTGAAFQC